MQEPIPPPAAARRFPPLKIGGKLQIWPPVVLAPMAGVTNYPYRKICRDLGAGLCITEMVSARALLEDNWKTAEIAEFGPEESPRSLQVFGADPEVMGEAVRRVRDRMDLDHVDINFGCPVPKVTKKGAGAAIPANPRLCRDVVRATVKAADPIPVSIKVRLGLDEDRFTFRDAAHIAEGEGCAYVAMHARTVKQMYSGKARWDYIRELKEAVTIPVLGNGDVFRAEDAIRLMEETGCDGVVIGRGCLGNPWLFDDLKRVFEGTGRAAPPSVDDLIGMVRLHYGLLREHFSEPRAADLAMRKFGTWYARGLRNATSIRRLFQSIEGPPDLERVLGLVAESGWHSGFRPFEPVEGERCSCDAPPGGDPAAARTAAAGAGIDGAGAGRTP